MRNGERVGVPWLGWTCGACRYCRSGRENLCADARFTGYTLDGGYGDYCIADGEAFLALAARTPIAMHVEPLPLTQANLALDRLRTGRLQGAAVLTMDGGA